MRVISWNMGCATKRYCSVREDAWRFLFELAPGVVLVQEAMSDVPSWVRDEGTLFIRSAFQGQNWGSGVLVRGGDPKERAIDVAGSYVTAADVELVGESVLIASIHVCPGRDLAKNVARLGAALSELLTGRRFVVGGDFNSCRHFDAVYGRRTHASLLEELSACGAHDCHFALHQREIQSYWGRALEPYQLDHLFVDGPTAGSVRTCKVLTDARTQSLSDHSPLLLELA